MGVQSGTVIVHGEICGPYPVRLLGLFGSGLNALLINQFFWVCFSPIVITTHFRFGLDPFGQFILCFDPICLIRPKKKMDQNTFWLDTIYLRLARQMLLIQRLG